MIPKIHIAYSPVYDAVLYYFSTGEWKDIDSLFFREKREYCNKKIKSLNSWWNPISKKVLRLIREMSKVPWKEDNIKFYFLKKPHKNIIIGGWSDPLTLFFQKYIKKKNRLELITMPDIWLKNSLIHELIHNNLSGKNIIKYTNKLMKKYSCDELTASHIPVHAILTEIYSKLLTKKHLKENIEYDNLHESYKKSWEIIKKEGHKNIIKDLQKYVG